MGPAYILRWVVGMLFLGHCWLACQKDLSDRPTDLLVAIGQGFESKDLGAIKNFVDINYQDDLGGIGRLEDDVRQLFAVYGRLQVQMEKVVIDAASLRAHVFLSGKNVKYSGSIELQLSHGRHGVLVQSGFFTDLRGILDTLRRRRLALERRSLDRLERLISGDYQDQVKGRDALLKKIGKEWIGLSEQTLIVSHLAIEVQGDLAQVQEQVTRIVLWKEQTIEKEEKESLRLRREGERWRFLGGLG